MALHTFLGNNRGDIKLVRSAVSLFKQDLKASKKELKSSIDRIQLCYKELEKVNVVK